MKVPEKYVEAAHLISSLRLAYVDVRNLEDSELIFILERAKELRISNVKEYIQHIKDNKKVLNKKTKKL